MTPDLIIRKAGPREYERALSFYYTLTDKLRSAEYDPRWRREVYPSRAYIKNAVEKGEMYFAVLPKEKTEKAGDGEEDTDVILGAMVINGSAADGYETAPWHTEAGDGEFSVIHTFCVDPDFSHRGIGRRMLAEAKRIAKEAGSRTVRLDVLTDNFHAIHLYEGAGFRFVTKLTLYYDNTGLCDFLLYDYAL